MPLPGFLLSSRTCHAPETACKSAQSREHLGVRWEPAGRLLGICEPAIHGNLEDTTAGLVQLYLRAGCLLRNQTCRRTGARFIASHSAIFDLDLHNLLSRLSPRISETTATAASCRDPPPSPKRNRLNHKAHCVYQTGSRQISRRRNSYALLVGRVYTIDRDLRLRPHRAPRIAVRRMGYSRSFGASGVNGFDQPPGVQSGKGRRWQAPKLCRDAPWRIPAWSGRARRTLRLPCRAAAGKARIGR
jgi:hypothetical protein